MFSFRAALRGVPMAVKKTSDSASPRPVRSEANRRASPPEAGSSYTSEPTSGVQRPLAKRLAAAGFQEAKGGSAAPVVAPVAAVERRRMRCRTAPAAMIIQAASEASAAGSSPRALHRDESCTGEILAEKVSSRLWCGSSKLGSPGRRKLAAMHIDIAAAACAELIKLLSKQAPGRDSLAQHTTHLRPKSYAAPDQGQEAGGDLESLVQRLTERVREAKVEAFAATQAKNELEAYWLSQQQHWEAEKVELRRCWAEEKAALQKQAEANAAKSSSAYKPRSTMQDQSSQTEPALHDTGSIPDPIDKCLGSDHHLSCSDTGQSLRNPIEVVHTTTAPFWQAGLTAALPAVDSSCADLAGSACDDSECTSATASLSGALPAWRVQAPSPPDDPESLKKDLESLGKHLAERFTQPVMLLTDIRNVVHQACGETLPQPRKLSRSASTPAALSNLGMEATVTAEIFEELVERWAATSIMASPVSDVFQHLSSGALELEVGELFSALTSAFTVDPATQVPDINKCVEAVRATRTEKKQIFLAQGTVSQKAMQYEQEVNRQRAALKRRNSMPSPSHDSNSF